MRGWPLTGRAQDLDTVIAALGSDRSQQGIALLGAAGVGKTRLAHEAAARAGQRGAAVRWLIGTPGGRTIPMGAMAEWADSIDGNPLNLVSQVTAAMTVGIGDSPLVLVVDDAHLLDELSAFVVLQLVLRGVATLVATVRSSESIPAALAMLWTEGSVRLFDLQALSRTDTERLLEAALGGPVSVECAGRLWDLTQGNVLYLRALVEQELRAGRIAELGEVWTWTGALEVTPSLMELVGLQFGPELGQVQDVVDLVVAAEPVERDCLSEIVDPAALAEAERRGLIVAAGEDGVMLRVGHPLFGEVRQVQAGRFRLRRLRGMVARALGARPDSDPVRVGMLWLQSDLKPDPVVLQRAAEQAVVRLDLVLGERFAGAAMAAGAATEVAILRAHLLVLLNDGQEADRILTSIAVSALPELVWSNVFHLRIANLLWPLAQPARAWEITREAEERATGPVLTAHVRAVKAAQLAMAGRPAEVASTMAGVDRDLLLAVPALLALWALTIAAGDLGDHAAAAEFAREGYRRSAAAPEATYQGVALVEFHVCALAHAGLLTEANKVAEQAMQQCASAPGISRSVATAMSGMAALFAGDLNQSVALLTRATADFEAYGLTTGIYYRYSFVYTEALARAGRLDEALGMQAKVRAARHPTFVFVEPDALLAQAWVAANRGHVTAARELAREAAEVAQRSGQAAREVYSLQVRVQFGDIDDVIATRLGELSATVHGPRVQLAVRYARALTAGDGDELLTLSGEFGDLGDHLTQADTAAQAVEVFHRRGRRGSALTAKEIVTRCVTTYGVRSPAVNAVTNPMPLTARQREVAMLIAEGLSNSEIAAELRASVRTVEGIVMRMSVKLGVVGRHGLTDYIVDISRPISVSEVGNGRARS